MIWHCRGLITDLYEGGNQAQLVRRMEHLASSGVRCMTLLALSDSGIPCYDKGLAKTFGTLGIPILQVPADGGMPVGTADIRNRGMLATVERAHDRLSQFRFQQQFDFVDHCTYDFARRFLGALGDLSA